jgi:hypothetical protein
MKKLTLTLCAAVAFASASFAGTGMYSSGKSMKQVEQAPCPTWYADNEWNIGISGIYAPTVNEWRTDTYLGVDHAWGGALDVKYFFRRYFGIGVQGFGLFANYTDRRFFSAAGDRDSSDFIGGVLGNFTFRYPIPCSRFAPYGWVGAGGIWGGGDRNVRFTRGQVFRDIRDEGKLMAQYGAGFETRFTQRVGWTNDISYNHLEGGRNDFLQVRTGLNFAF